jgi:hypothetical protein
MTREAIAYSQAEFSCRRAIYTGPGQTFKVCDIRFGQRATFFSAVGVSAESFWTPPESALPGVALELPRVLAGQQIRVLVTNESRESARFSMTFLGLSERARVAASPRCYHGIRREHGCLACAMYDGEAD